MSDKAEQDTTTEARVTQEMRSLGLDSPREISTALQPTFTDDQAAEIAAQVYQPIYAAIETLIRRKISSGRAEQEKV